MVPTHNDYVMTTSSSQNTQNKQNKQNKQKMKSKLKLRLAQLIEKKRPDLLFKSLTNKKTLEDSRRLGWRH
jgi:hypothetical protein